MDGAESLEEVIKLFGYIELETTKQFLSAAIADLSADSVHSAYFGVRSIEDILDRFRTPRWLRIERGGTHSLFRETASNEL